MINKIIVLLTLMVSIKANSFENKIGVYSDFDVFDNITNKEKGIYYYKKINKNSYGLSLAETEYYYDQEKIDDDQKLKFDMNVFQKEDVYWSNNFSFSNKGSLFPNYKIELNRMSVYENEELGIGLSFADYKKTSIYNTILQSVIYLNNGDYFAGKANMIYYNDFNPNFLVYYAFVFKKMTLKPYVAFGKSIEDVNLTDKFNTVGVESLFTINENISIKNYIESYKGTMRSEQKIGITLEIDF